jgi:hypothetical protein
MVKNQLKKSALVLSRVGAVALAMSLFSCGKFWKESPPPANVVQMNSTGSSCPLASSILDPKVPSETARTSLQCWTDKVNGIWNQIEGETPNTLTEKEIQTLINKGVIQFGVSPAQAAERVHSLMQLFGAPGKLTRDQTTAWTAWAATNLDSIRTVYAKLTAADPQPTAADFRLLATVASSALSLANWDNSIQFKDLNADLVNGAGLSKHMADRISAAEALFSLDTSASGATSANEILRERLAFLTKDATQIELLVMRVGKASLGFQVLDVDPLAKLANDFLTQVNWPSSFRGEDLVSAISTVFDVGAPSQAKLLNGVVLIGADGSDALAKLRSRAGWMIAHWDDAYRAINQGFTQGSGSGPSFLADDSMPSKVELLNSFLTTFDSTDDLSASDFESKLTSLVTLTPNQLTEFHAVEKLAGLTGKHFRQNLEARGAWLAANWPRLKAAYVNFWPSSNPRNFLYSDFSDAVNVIASLLGQINLQISSNDLVDSLNAIFTINDPYIRRSLLPGASIALNTLQTFCPNLDSGNVWTSSSIGTCLAMIPNQFQSGREWAEFWLSPITVTPSKAQLTVAQNSLSALQTKISEWFAQPGHQPLNTNLLLNFSDAIGAHPPTGFVNSLNIISHFDPKSTGPLFQPSVANFLVSIYVGYIKNVFSGIIPFIDASLASKCQSPSVRDWQKCVPKSGFASLRTQYPGIELAMEVKPSEYGQNAVPLSGTRFINIMRYDSVAAQILKAFSKDGHLITADNSDGKDEVTNLLDVGLASEDVIQRFYTNFRDRLQGLPVSETTPRRTFAGVDLAGLARLLTLYATDLLVDRTQAERNQIKIWIQNLSQFVTIVPDSTSFLDQKAVTAILTFVDGFSDYQNAYYSIIVPFSNVPELGFPAQVISSISQSPDHLPRERVLFYLPQILQQTFPTTFASCKTFGFMKSCGISFDEILPHSDDDPDFMSVSDLDLLTIVAAGMEGVLRACDFDGDGQLGLNEVSCATALFTDTTTRLLKSNLVNVHKSTFITGLLTFLKSTPLTRVFGDVPLIQGSTQYMGLSYFDLPPILLQEIFTQNQGRATLGTMYGLFSDILDPDRTRQTKN